MSISLLIVAKIFAGPMGVKCDLRGKVCLDGNLLPDYRRAMTPQVALKKAIKIAGGLSALGRALKIKRQAVSQWRKAPAERVISIEAAAGGQITRHDLRPDLYPKA